MKLLYIAMFPLQVILGIIVWRRNLCHVKINKKSKDQDGSLWILMLDTSLPCYGCFHDRIDRIMS
jgi:hypothetical protein